MVIAKEAVRAAVARAATLIEPDAKLQKDAPDLISAMLAAGYDQAAGRWTRAVARMDDDDADRCWAMLALASTGEVDVSSGRIRPLSAATRAMTACAARCSSRVLPGLAGSAPIGANAQSPLRPWARTDDRLDPDHRCRGGRRPGGTVLVLTGTGFQTPSFDRCRPRTCIMRSGLKRTGQDFTARMIAAEALSRT